MSANPNLKTFLAQPFGDEVDPKGFWLLLLGVLSVSVREPFFESR